MTGRPRIPAPTLLDRAIAAVAPGAAIGRLKNRAIYASLAGQSGYEGARRDRPGLRGYNPRARSADEDTLLGLPDLRARSRDLAMNAPIAGGAIATVKTNVIGTGLRVRPAVDRVALAGRGVTDAEAEAFEQAAEREFALFSRAEHCDSTGELSFPAMQALAFRGVLEAGDCFAAMVKPEFRGPYDFCVQLIEGDRCSNPGRARDTDALSGGVERTPGGRPVAYHMEVVGRAQMALAVSRWDRLPAIGSNGLRTVLHLHEKQRIEQTRGVPYLAPIIGLMRDLQRYTDAEITAAVLTACIALTTTTGSPQGVLQREAAEGGATPGAGGGLARAEIDFEPGLVIEGLRPGETVASFGPERPSTGFDPFVTSMLRQVGVALELPYEILIKHFQASYSASRAALLEAWRAFRTRRAWFAEAMCQPIYEAVLTNAIHRGRLVAPGFLADPLARMAWCRARWTGPSPGQIDPLREVEAAEARIALRISTRSRETAELTGDDWEAVAQESASEEALCRALGLGLSAKTTGVAPGVPPAPAPAALPAPPRRNADQATQDAVT